MPELINARWTPRFESGLSRRQRQGCTYQAYVPDPLCGRRWRFAGDVAADVADAEQALARLDASARSLTSSEALARLLLRAESVSSSRIEGLQIGGRRLLHAQAAAAAGQAPTDVSATEIIANIDAMAFACDQVEAGTQITLSTLLQTHRLLLAGTRLASHAGVVRIEQNWIGGSAYNPCNASFIPPPPDRLPALLDDLVAFINDDHLPPVAQAAISHAQFETLHPFADGNGRTGRALIHMVLRRRGLCRQTLAPISLVLATRADEYVDGLSATRTAPQSSGAVMDDAWDNWIGTFAAATVRAVGDARAFQTTVERIQARWREQLPGLRADATASLLIDQLAAAPVLSVETAARLTSRSKQAANEALRVLTEAGIVKQTTSGQRNRIFEAPALISAFNALERQLASPDADTRHSPPTRPAPARAPHQT
ncbi:MAG: Fic family protein [Patulibacter sp.]